MSKSGDFAINVTLIAQTGVCPVESSIVTGVPKGCDTKSVLNKQFA